MARRGQTDGMEQLRAILFWTVAISLAVIIAGVATGNLTFGTRPLPARSAVQPRADSAIG